MLSKHFISIYHCYQFYFLKYPNRPEIFRFMCDLGERVSGCCSHVATAIHMGCAVAHNPGLFRSTASACNLLDRINPRMSEELARQGLHFTKSIVSKKIQEKKFIDFLSRLRGLENLMRPRRTIPPPPPGPL